MSKRLLAVLFEKSKAVGELLRGLSCVVHLMLILYRANGTVFMTSQLHHDPQALFRGVFFVVLQARSTTAESRCTSGRLVRMG